MPRHIQLPKLNYEEIQNPNRPTTRNEIKRCKVFPSVGPHGFTANSYQTFKAKHQFL